MKHLKHTDPEIFQALKAEFDRQTNQLEMIASENFVSEAVMEAEGSLFMNKYAEGYPGARYYGGCEYMDVVESLAIERLKGIFKSDYANVQSHSGSQANMAVYFAVLNPGDTILAMNLAHGGHLTHGAKASFSGRLYNAIHYGVRRDTETIDYEQMEELARRHRPKLIIAGASSYPRFIDFLRFKKIAKEVGAYFMVDMAHIAGLVAAGVHPSPVPHADFITSTTHKTMRGPRGGFILSTQEFSKKLNKEIFPGIQGGPLMQIIAAKAVSFEEAMSEEFGVYQQRVVANSKALAKTLLDNGFRLVSGGTDNHLILVDLTNKRIKGKDAQERLERAGITVNKNSIPFDNEPPGVTSGIRIGTPAVTTRGLGEKEMGEVGGYISELLNKPDNEGLIKAIKEEIGKICKRFPIYEERRTKYAACL